MKQKNTTTKVSKWGNSLGIRLPLEIVNSLNVTEGSELLLSQDKDFIKISLKEESFEDLSLDIILKGITPDILKVDSENMFGKPQGNEIW